MTLRYCGDIKYWRKVVLKLCIVKELLAEYPPDRYTVPASDIPSVTNCLNVKNRLNPGPSSAYSHTPTFTSRKRGKGRV